MLGIIIIGHGHFASGLLSSVKLIAGEQKKLEIVDFKEGDSSEILNGKIKEAISRLSNENIAIFTDIPGGTPFNQSVLISKEYSQVKVITGTNLPAIIDGLFNREMDIEDFVEKVMQSGKDSLISNNFKKTKQNTSTDGI
jgi:PTS system N-acetylgalactosamine-specific IIA component